MTLSYAILCKTFPSTFSYFSKVQNDYLYFQYFLLINIISGKSYAITLKIRKSKLSNPRYVSYIYVKHTSSNNTAAEAALLYSCYPLSNIHCKLWFITGQTTTLYQNNSLIRKFIKLRKPRANLMNFITDTSKFGTGKNQTPFYF